jgi:hypothetical protein
VEPVAVRSIALTVAFTVGLLLVGAGPASARPAPVPVPIGDFLVCKGNGHLFVLSPGGKTLGRTPGTTGPHCATGLALAAGRRTAYFAVLTGDETPPSLERIDRDLPNHPISKRIYPPPPAPTSTVTPPPGVPVVRVAPPPAPTTATSRAPVYLDAHTLVAVYDCCIGSSHLVAFDLRTGKRTAFATLDGPPVNSVRLGSGRVLLVTAANLLVVASRGRTEQLATGISAATA